VELSTVNRGSALWTVKKSIEAPPTGEEQHSNTLIGEERAVSCEPRYGKAVLCLPGDGAAVYCTVGPV
jgi:hypothetical protein